jgi:glycosyltransferase involved in cell wall biosynthesis
MLGAGAVRTVTFLGAGDNSYVDALRSDCWASGLSGIEFLPVTKDPAPHYVRSDVLVCPSYTETLPGVVLEARLAGLEVVASDLSGIRAAAAEHPVTWFKPGDAAALASALREVAKRGARRVEEDHDVPDAKGRAELLRRLLNEVA